jgi:hypothetical protein
MPATALQPVQPVVYVKPLAVNQQTAAAMLGISRWTLRRLWAAGEIRRTSYGTYLVEDLERHVRNDAS